MPLHSKTVRGTLGNKKTQEAMQSNSNRTQLGDPESLEVEKSDAAPQDGPSMSGGAERTPAAPSSSSPPSSSNSSDLPHSMRVRGTKANASGSKTNKTMLGDPASLKAETSEIGVDQRNENSEQEEMQRAAEKRKGESKL
ncbi:hypothetical protein BDV95DRAFT_558442 [Massariosphaeria phaeospora]|uniref:Uncharacterized protein n=1 Tax=Massariosphaeria phaeospora TaxID=100035 RepID=A0A7C8MMK6_9PLEO|nr:hypothetical protein BDV95DRAFT_558442 [Massariosphaeria phaeospora]